MPDFAPLGSTHELYALGDSATLPRIMKSLGAVGPNTLAHYGIAHLHDDLDIDREAELKQMLHNAMLAVYRARVDPTEQRGFALRFAKRDLIVVYERIGEPFYASIH